MASKTSLQLAHEMQNTQLSKGFAALWFLGQEGFVILINGKYILVDAFFMERETRLYPPVMNAHDLDFIDYIFCSHQHLDHTDPESLPILSQINKKARFILPEPVVGYAEELGIPKDRIDSAVQDVRLSFDGLDVMPVPAAHEEIHYSEKGCCRELGYVFMSDGIRIYHAGDSCPYEGQAERIGHPDIALLPINGRDFYRFQRGCIGNMDMREALLFAEETDAGIVIPMHYDMFRGNTVNVAGFVDILCRDFADRNFKVMQKGERFIFMK